ncbi:hypothetical protein ACVWW6_004155 [Bradyrhizobium sp. USDA 3311]
MFPGRTTILWALDAASVWAAFYIISPTFETSPSGPSLTRRVTDLASTRECEPDLLEGVLAAKV